MPQNTAVPAAPTLGMRQMEARLGLEAGGLGAWLASRYHGDPPRSQAQIARELGITKGTVSKWMHAYGVHEGIRYVGYPSPKGVAP